jgi:LmbE family N-acetylglucosaminyl deacetylase
VSDAALPVYQPDPSITRALVVVAHPDDIDFGIAGTVAVLTGHGVDVAYCLVTSGDAGGDASTHTKDERAAIREAEQTAAAAAVGVTKLTFLRWPDGEVEPTLELRKAISRAIRAHRPDLVITQNPERNFERIYASHPDHMAAGEATLCAVYPDARNPHAFPELLEEGFASHAVPTVWVVGSTPTLVVDITDTFASKIAALKSHISQVGHREDLDEMMRTWATTNAEVGGLPAGRLAETFRVVNTA